MRIGTRKTKAEAKKIVESKNRVIRKSSFSKDKKFSYRYRKLKKGYGIYKVKR